MEGQVHVIWNSKLQYRYAILEGQQLVYYERFDHEERSAINALENIDIRNVRIEKKKLEGTKPSIRVITDIEEHAHIIQYNDENTCNVWVEMLTIASKLHVEEENRARLPNKCRSLLQIDLTTKLTKQAISQAYNKLLETIHPDSGGDIDEFNRVHQAYINLMALQVIETENDAFACVHYGVSIRKLGGGVGLGIDVQEDTIRRFIMVQGVDPNIHVYDIDKEADGAIRPGDELVSIDRDICKNWNLHRLKARLSAFRVPIGSVVRFVFARRYPKKLDVKLLAGNEDILTFPAHAGDSAIEETERDSRSHSDERAAHEYQPPDSDHLLTMTNLQKINTQNSQLKEAKPSPPRLKGAATPTAQSSQQPTTQPQQRKSSLFSMFERRKATTAEPVDIANHHGSKGFASGGVTGIGGGGGGGGFKKLINMWETKVPGDAVPGGRAPARRSGDREAGLRGGPRLSFRSGAHFDPSKGGLIDTDDQSVQSLSELTVTTYDGWYSQQAATGAYFDADEVNQEQEAALFLESYDPNLFADNDNGAGLQSVVRGTDHIASSAPLPLPLPRVGGHIVPVTQQFPELLLLQQHQQSQQYHDEEVEEEEDDEAVMDAWERETSITEVTELKEFMQFARTLESPHDSVVGSDHSNPRHHSRQSNSSAVNSTSFARPPAGDVGLFGMGVPKVDSNDSNGTTKSGNVALLSSSSSTLRSSILHSESSSSSRDEHSAEKSSSSKPARRPSGNSEQSSDKSHGTHNSTPTIAPFPVLPFAKAGAASLDACPPVPDSVATPVSVPLNHRPLSVSMESTEDNEKEILNDSDEKSGDCPTYAQHEAAPLTAHIQPVGLTPLEESWAACFIQFPFSSLSSSSVDPRHVSATDGAANPHPQQPQRPHVPRGNADVTDEAALETLQAEMNCAKFEIHSEESFSRGVNRDGFELKDGVRPAATPESAETCNAVFDWITPVVEFFSLGTWRG